MAAKRSQRLIVIGALLSSGRLVMAKLWRSINGLWFLGFFMALAEQATKPIAVILDNSSFSKANLLVPYSPESNRIEILWKKMK